MSDASRRHRRAVSAKVFYDLLEVDVFDSGAVDDGNLVGLEFQIGAKVRFEKTQRLNTFGEDDNAVGWIGWFHLRNPPGFSHSNSF